jgi:hypothetical protein
MKRVALCMRGAVGKESGAFFKKNDLYHESNFVNYTACYHSIRRHILETNPGYSFDVFCQSWNPEIEKELTELYRPVKSLFEDNRLYNEDISKKCREDHDFSGLSQALAIKKSIQLKNDYAQEMNRDYDLVILYRYDVLLWKDIRLDEYTDVDSVYVNAHPGSNGDFHFIMSHSNSTLFMNLYDSVELGNHQVMHSWIQHYVVSFMKKHLRMDSIYPGLHQECIRKIQDHSIDKGHLTLEQFNSYR